MGDALFDITLERPTGTGETVLDEFEGVTKLMNVPGVGKAKVTYPDGSTDMSPCGQVVSIEAHDPETN